MDPVAGSIHAGGHDQDTRERSANEKGSSLARPVEHVTDLSLYIYVTMAMSDFEFKLQLL